MKNYEDRYMLVFNQVFYLIERYYILVFMVMHLAHKAYEIISKGTISWSTIRLHMLVQIINLFTFVYVQLDIYF